MTVSALQTLHQRYAQALEDEIEAWLSLRPDQLHFYDMMRYQLGYATQDFRPSSGGGKRFRPLLCLAVCEAHGGDWRDALPLAAGIELLHNFSLIHDDIEDRDPERRHRPTVWKVWGEAIAINIGDGMFALAARAASASTVDPMIAWSTTRAFEETSLALTEGQHLDMTFENRMDVTFDQYLEMIALKTAALIGFSTWSGALLGGASNDQASAIHDFGTALGKAFQIQDDIAGIWAPAEKTGKQPAKDLENRKKTLPIVLAFAHADEQQRRQLELYFQGGNHDVENVLRILHVTDARKAAEQELRNQLQKCHASLKLAALPAARGQELITLANELTGGLSTGAAQPGGSHEP